jgi:multimeric flavodoxin WrbA
MYLFMMENFLREEIDKIKKMMILEESSNESLNSLKKTLDILSKKNKVLLLSCSNRYNWDENNIDIPKSKILAEYLKEELGGKAVLIDVPDLKIFPCEGNVSRKEGNSCGLLKALLKDKKKNPSGNHRCWASLNNKTDELWKISKELFESEAVLFFTSVRWGQANMFYQNLIERLTWIENINHSLDEKNLVENIESGFICVGQNWGGENIIDVQKEVHKFYGFKINNNLYWNWQYTQDKNDETLKSYKNSYKTFIKDFNLNGKK